MARTGRPLTAEDRALIGAAVEALRLGYRKERHTVGAAVRTGSGTIYRGLNLNGNHSPCAEPVAIGAAVTAGERDLECMVAVCRRGTSFPILSPCGTCRQLLLDYAPGAEVIVAFDGGRVGRIPVVDSLPGAYRSFSDE